MPRSAHILWIVLLGLALPAQPVRSQVTDAQVAQAIESIKEELYFGQNREGYWDPPGPEGGRGGRNYGGLTAIVTYALLTAGDSYQDPRLVRAIDFLQRVNMTGTYAVSFRTHVWATLPPQFDRNVNKDFYWMQKAVRPGAGDGLAWHYMLNDGGWDNSTTQYGLLGIWEAAKRDVAVPKTLWAGVEKHFLATQNADGGWGYHVGETRASMTTAGLAALFITRDFVHNADFRRVGVTPTHPIQQRIDLGMKWLAENYTPGVNTGHPGLGHAHYYMYGVERVGLASGHKYIGGKDWYRSGAEWLIANPGADHELAFSLLFLVRGRVPVFMNKLAIADYHWNSRPADIARLTQWSADQLEKKMLWQVVDLRAEPQDWLDAPILFISSHQPLALDDAGRAKLKRFIDLGGMIVTTADADSEEFTRSVQTLMHELYPNLQYQALSDGDELLDMLFRMDNELGAQSLHNGVRHIALHIPTDITWTLHSGDVSQLAPWRLLTNAYVYATERGRSRNRLDSHYLARLPAPATAAPAADDAEPPATAAPAPPLPKITVARASYEGNWDPEPLAWEMLGNFMFNEGLAELEVTTAPLHELPDPLNVPLVYVAGTRDMTFSDLQVQAIRRYVNGGGHMVFENAGGRGQFAHSVVDMLRDAFPDQRLRPLSLQSSLATGEGIGGYDITRIDFRPYVLLRIGQVQVPRLLTMTFDGEPRIIVSGEDLTHGLLGQPAWGVFGYTTDSSRRMLSNVVLGAALNRARAASTRRPIDR